MLINVPLLLALFTCFSQVFASKRVKNSQVYRFEIEFKSTLADIEALSHSTVEQSAENNVKMFETLLSLKEVLSSMDSRTKAKLSSHIRLVDITVGKILEKVTPEGYKQFSIIALGLVSELPNPVSCLSFFFQHGDFKNERDMETLLSFSVNLSEEKEDLSVLFNWATDMIESFETLPKASEKVNAFIATYLCIFKKVDSCGFSKDFKATMTRIVGLANLFTHYPDNTIDNGLNTWFQYTMENFNCDMLPKLKCILELMTRRLNTTTIRVAFVVFAVQSLFSNLIILQDTREAMYALIEKFSQKFPSQYELFLSSFDESWRIQIERFRDEAKGSKYIKVIDGILQKVKSISDSSTPEQINQIAKTFKLFQRDHLINLTYSDLERIKDDFAREFVFLLRAINDLPFEAARNLLLELAIVLLTHFRSGLAPDQLTSIEEFLFFLTLDIDRAIITQDGSLKRPILFLNRFPFPLLDAEVQTVILEKVAKMEYFFGENFEDVLEENVVDFFQNYCDFYSFLFKNSSLFKDVSHGYRNVSIAFAFYSTGFPQARASFDDILQADFSLYAEKMLDDQDMEAEELVALITFTAKIGYKNTNTLYRHLIRLFGTREWILLRSVSLTTGFDRNKVILALLESEAVSRDSLDRLHEFGVLSSTEHHIFSQIKTAKP